MKRLYLEVVQGNVVDEAAADGPGLGLPHVHFLHVERVGLRMPPRPQHAPHPDVQRLRRLPHRIRRGRRLLCLGLALGGRFGAEAAAAAAGAGAAAAAATATRGEMEDGREEAAAPRV